LPGIWGARRKRDEPEEVEVEAGGDIPVRGFEATRRNFEAAKKPSLVDALPSRETILAGINAYIGIVEKMVESPDFSSLVTPENLQAMLSQLPGLSDSPEVNNPTWLLVQRNHAFIYLLMRIS